MNANFFGSRTAELLKSGESFTLSPFFFMIDILPEL